MKKVLVVGGGSAGISIIARMSSLMDADCITLIEPSKDHYYQPFWTLNGAGVGDKKSTKALTQDFIPQGVHWVSDRVKEFFPDSNEIFLERKNTRLSYDVLIVCPGIQVNWDEIKGLKSGMGKSGICSNYSYDYVDSTWEAIQNTKSGRALFTYPSTPIKCGGAPQKIMYLAEDYFHQNGVRKNVSVEFFSAGTQIFGIPKYKAVLERILKERDLKTFFHFDLKEVDHVKKLAYFENIETNEKKEVEFSMIHVTPPQSAPNFIRNSVLANKEGWVNVDKYTCQHLQFANIFSLGDASSLPTSKTGAAVRKQVPVVVENVLSFMEGSSLKAKYEGYTSCPIVTGYGKLVLAEFDYSGKPCETFPFDQAQERFSMYLMKKYLLPKLYWYGMLRGLL